jgi:hypothetical protein
MNNQDVPKLSTIHLMYVPTHQLYTSCMCQLINCLSQPYTQHVPQPKALINSSSKSDLYLCNRLGVFDHISTNIP